MSNLFFDNDTVSTNETAFVNLPEGRHTYKIIKASFSTKADSSGTKKPTGVNVAFLKEDSQTRHTHHYATAAEGDRGRLARGDMKALWDAMKLGGSPGPDRFPNFEGKRVEILVTKTPNANNPDAEPYTNIKGTWPAGDTPRAAESPAAPTYTADDALPEAEPAPAETKPVPSWKKRPQPAAAE